MSRPPAPAEPHLTPEYDGHAAYAPAQGPVFAGPPRGTEVQQQQLGDCFFLAALASFAQRRPEALRAAVREREHDVTVRLYRHDHATGTFIAEEITVDRALPEERGAPIYATSTGGRALWVSFFEKAYAAHLGSYGALDHGGIASFAMQVLTGAPAHATMLAHAPAEAIWSLLEGAIAARKLTTASTFEAADARKTLAKKQAAGDAAAHAYHAETFTYERHGLVDGHDYTVWALHGAHGDRALTLRNPWAFFEPGHDGHDDGLFTLPFDAFRTLFANVYVGG
jgi:hypothetical protein